VARRPPAPNTSALRNVDPTVLPQIVAPLTPGKPELLPVWEPDTAPRCWADLLRTAFDLLRLMP
jgi:hypothetical protein